MFKAEMTAVTGAMTSAFQRGKSWARQNPTEATLGAVAVSALAYWLLKKRYSQPMSFVSRSLVSGVWTDLANKQGLSTGTDLTVQEVQGYLNVINGKTSPAQGGNGLLEDGIAGNATAAAVRAFQSGNGLPVTGLVDEETGSAISYFATATSSTPAIKKYAAVSPDTIQSLSDDYAPPFDPFQAVTYTPYAMPQQPQARTQAVAPIAPMARARPQPRRPAPKGKYQAVDIGQGWVMYGKNACRWDDAACAARSNGIRPTMPPPSVTSATAGEYRTGAQSTTMTDMRFAYTDEWGHEV